MKIMMAIKKVANCSIGIIGGSDGPTSIFVATNLGFWGRAAGALLAVIAVGAVVFWFLKKRKR